MGDVVDRDEGRRRECRLSAVVTEVFAGKEDNGVFTAYVRLSGVGWGQSFGGLALEGPGDVNLTRFLEALCALFGVDDAKELVGRKCEAVWNLYPGRAPHIEGLANEDGAIFTITSFRRACFPGWEWDPLARMVDEEERAIRRLAESIKNHIDELSRIRRDFVDWEGPAAETTGAWKRPIPEWLVRGRQR